MRLVITICATKSYTYALVAQARRIVAAILQCPSVKEGCMILVGDNCLEMERTEQLYRNILPHGFEVRRMAGSFADGLTNYEHPAQLVIARMRSTAFDEARRQSADVCWSLDSDVLPQAHSLECMMQGLAFSSGHYSVSTCPYPSQGGGDFLAGRGTPERPILPDIFDDERIIPRKLQVRLERHGKRLKEFKGAKPDSEWFKEQETLPKLVQKCPPRGDVFFLNSRTGVAPFANEVKRRIADALPKMPSLAAKLMKEVDAEVVAWQPHGFRRRGWMSAAYPAIGIGTLIPTDWCGFGCTLMSRQALSLAQLDGYDGAGTEDLYVVWKRWHRASLRINSIPHAPCDHVIRDRDHPGKFILMQAFHETRDAECVGHLRVERRPWFQQTDGEKAPGKRRISRSVRT